MRILAVSDSHGTLSPLEIAIEKSKPDIVVFLGDGLNAAENLEYMYDNIKFYFVKGNCDFGDGESRVIFKAGSKTVFATHGHLYNVKYTYETIKQAARDCGADIVMFGHTHTAYEEYDEGLYVLNPGSVSRPNTGKPSYGYVDIAGNSVVTNIVYI